jgi:hypothetical protein
MHTLQWLGWNFGHCIRDKEGPIRMQSLRGKTVNESFVHRHGPTVARADFVCAQISSTRESWAIITKNALQRLHVAEHATVTVTWIVDDARKNECALHQQRRWFLFHAHAYGFIGRRIIRGGSYTSKNNSERHVAWRNLRRFALLANDSVLQNSQQQSLSGNEGATATSRTHLAWSCVSDFARQTDCNAHSAPETPLESAVPEAVNLMLFWVPLPEKLVPLQVTLLTV